MTAPAHFVFNGDAVNGILPRYPSVEDLGGGNYVNATDSPPFPNDPDALDFNQQQRVLAAVAKMAPVLVLEVTFTAAAACAVTGFWSANENIDESAVSLSYSSALTQLIVNLPLNSLPSSSRRPEASTHVGTVGFYGQYGSRASSVDGSKFTAPATVAVGTILTLKIYGVP